MFQLYLGHAQAELVVGTGEAGQFVFVGPGEIIAVVKIGGARDEEGGCIRGRRGGAGGRVEKGRKEKDQQGIPGHGDRFGLIANYLMYILLI